MKFSEDFILFFCKKISLANLCHILFFSPDLTFKFIEKVYDNVQTRFIHGFEILKNKKIKTLHQYNFQKKKKNPCLTLEK